MEQKVMADLVAAGLITTNGCMLLIEKGGKRTLPTGHMEFFDKTLEKTLKREMKEELGVKVSVKETLGTVVRRKHGGGVLKLIEIFYCQVSEESAKMVRYEEKGEKGQIWMEFSKALSLENLDVLAREGIKRFLKKYPNKAKGGEGYEKENCFFLLP